MRRLRLQFSKLIHIGVFLLLGMTGWCGRVYSADNDAIKELQRRIKTEPKLELLFGRHPDEAPRKILSALESSMAGEAQETIEILEPLLLEQIFGGLTERETSSTARLWVGTRGSFSVWRELAYLLLGQNYYRLGKYKVATSYLLSVPEDSPFSGVATTEAVWAMLKVGELEAAEKTVTKISKGQESPENGVQRAYIFLQKGRETDAILEVEKLSPQKLSREVQSIRLKILAQGEYQRMLQKVATMGFQEKKAILEKVIRHCEDVEPRYRDANFSSLGAEAHWHLSSVYRVEDPSKYGPLALRELNKANEWISPWIERAKGGQTQIAEAIHFLAVAVLWEQERKDEAIPRLTMLPRLFPMGEYREDASQLLADYYYDSGRFNEALHYYTDLTRLGSEKKAAYGTYKAAWAFYNQEEKWKALRHLERLVLHYRELIRDDKGDTDKATQGALVKESIQDMMLILGELLPYRTALLEVDYFQFPPKKKIELQERLGKVYKEIGKYDDSVEVWKRLIAESPQSPRTYEWLNQMTLAFLSSGKRRQIAEAFDQYIPKLPNDSSEATQTSKTELQKQATQLLLTIHREARKTDDEEIWTATDALYRTFEKHFPDSKEGDAWYFGAQRKEQLQKPWEAMEWYRRAGEVAGYTNAADAGIGVLRHAKEIGEKATHANQKGEIDYAKLASYPQWYIQTFKKSKERKLAEFLLLEYLFKAKDFNAAKQYLVRTINEEGTTPEHQDQYLSYNRRLYENKLWLLAYELARDVMEVVHKKADAGAKSFEAKLTRFRQETAFEYAFQAETAKEFDNARKWYRVAITDAADSLVTLKAWHNWIVSYSGAGKSGSNAQDEYEKLSNEFEESFKKPIGKDLDKERTNLILNIYLHRVGFWEAAGSSEKRVQAVFRAADYEPDPLKADAMRWEATVQSGLYYDLPTLKQGIEGLQKAKSPAFREIQNQITAARLFMWNGDLTTAWKMLSEKTQLRQTPLTVWTGIADLYRIGHDDSSGIGKEIKAFLEKQKAEQKDNVALVSLYQQFLSPKEEVMALSKSIDKLKKNKKENPKPKGPFETPQHELKARVDYVGATLQEAAVQDQILTPYYGNKSIYVSVRAICHTIPFSTEVIENLESLKKPPIASPQWKQFLKMLESKIRELRGDLAKLDKNCESGKETLSLFPAISIVKDDGGYLCDREYCFPMGAKARGKMDRLEVEWKKQNTPRLLRIWQALEMGAWTIAENTAYSATNLKEKSLLLAIIRLALNDTVNATALLKEAKADAQWADHASALIARIYLKNGYAKLAKDELAKIRREKLFDWERELISEIK